MHNIVDIGMVECQSEIISITTFGPVIIVAAFFWYSITGWDESLLKKDGSAPNLRSKPSQGWKPLDEFI